MKTTFFKMGLPPVVLGLLLCQTGLAAVNLTITPSAVSNTYSGTITLQVTGLTNTETVVVQKFLDLNTNGTIDAADLLIQQFNLTDGQAGMVIGGVTNINVPGDTDGMANGTITATLNFQNGDFIQTTIGNYLFKLSSPSGHFSPITDSFNVTNFLFAQKITGNVVNSGTNVPDAVVILFPPPRVGNHGPGTPVAEAVANHSGSYTIQVPPGTYVPLAFKSNYIANYGTSPMLTLTDSQTISTNLTLINATRSISGKLVDAANNSVGLPGISIPASTKGGFIAIGFTDTNGNFVIPVSANQWQIEGEPSGLILHGYVGYQNGTNIDTTGGGSGLIFAFSKANELFYGHVDLSGLPDGFGNPFPGIDINANDEGNMYSADGYSDVNGNYVVGVFDPGYGLNWSVQVSNDNNPANYIFSQGAGSIPVSNGMAMDQDFTAILATNSISGNVKYDGTNLIGVAVSAYANIGGQDYNVGMDTDDNGNYSLNVANTNIWSVSVSCQGGDDSLDNILGNGNYECPDNQSIAINNNNGTANFTIQDCNGVQINTTSLANGQVGNYYDTVLDASSCSGNINWSLNSGSLPSGLTLDSDGELHGTPNSSGTFNFFVKADDGNGNTATQSLSLTINVSSTPLQITTTFLPGGTNTLFYSQTLQASGGAPPYSWSIPAYSADPPANLTLATNGVLSGTLADSVGTHYFDVQVTDANSTTADQSLQLNIDSAPLPPLIITNTSLPNGSVGAAYSAQLGATGGQPPYYWQLATGSANLPTGLALDSSGLISGTPTTNKVSTFKVQVTDSNISDPPTNKVLSITITRTAAPMISALSHFSNGQFQMTVTNVTDINYTVQMSTNLSSANWIPLLITNPSSGSFLFNDANATNRQRFYRVIGQFGP